jgi:hypothetical protein
MSKKQSQDDIKSDLAEAREYLQKVEKELAIRQEALALNKREQVDLKRRLRSVNVERGLRLGRVQHLQVLEAYRRDVNQQLKKLQEKGLILLTEVNRAEERREMVLEEINELTIAVDNQNKDKE